MKQREPSNPLAARLRELRPKAMSQAEAGRRIGVSKYTISRAETGAFAPSTDTVKKLCDVYGVAPEVRDQLVQRFEDLREGTTAIRVTLQHGGWPLQERIRRIEEQAELIRVWGVMVPGPAQTEAYIRGVMSPFLQGEDLERTVQSRLVRQQLLNDSKREFHFVMQEGAVRWPLLDPAGMVEQLEQLIEVAHRPNVTLAVIPDTTTIGLHPVGGFYIYDSTVVITTTANATAITTAPNDLEDYGRCFERFDERAAQGDAAIAVVARVADEFRARLT